VLSEYDDYLFRQGSHQQLYEPVAAHGHAQSLALTLPPLSAHYFEPA
jgi:hypothetical protein